MAESGYELSAGSAYAAQVTAVLDDLGVDPQDRVLRTAAGRLVDARRNVNAALDRVRAYVNAEALDRLDAGTLHAAAVLLTRYQEARNALDALVAVAADAHGGQP